MMQHARRADAPHPVIERMTALAALDDAAIAALGAAIAHARPVAQRRDLLTEGRPIAEPLIVVRGWAARVRIFPDGQRQFLSFLLPGDLIGMCRHAHPLAVSTVVAVTDMLVCTAPSVVDAPALGQAYAVSLALEEAYLLAHIGRLGRLNAQERIADLMLELHERLTTNGMSGGQGFDMPLTQEMLGDALGLTSVHVNRMIQLWRKAGGLEWRGGRVTLTDPAALTHLIQRVPPRVCSAMPG